MTDTIDTPRTATTETTTTSDIGGFIWYELMTPNPAGAKAFYDAVVGWDIATTSTGPEGMDYRMITRSDGGSGGGVLKLTEDMRSHGARPTWLGYLHVADVDAAIRAIESDGGKTLMPASDVPEVGRIAMVADPAGAPFYIMKPIPPADRPDAKSDLFSVDQPQHVRWNELSTTDQDGAIDFYTEHFGWVQKDGMPMGEMGEYKFIWQGGVMIGAIMRKMPQTPASTWLYYIGVDDIDRATKAIADGGGTILNGPMEIPGGEYSLAGMDPQGAVFGLVGPRK